MLVQAENISNMTSERIKNSFKLMKAKGYKFGNAPYGYTMHKDNNGIKKLKRNNDEQNIIKIIMNEYKKKVYYKYYVKETNIFVHRNIFEKSKFKITK